MNSADLPDNESSLKGTRDWPHAPPHRLGAAGVYFVTVRTLEKLRYFHTPERLTWVCDHLHELAAHYRWRMEAWAVLNNHCHLVAHSPSGEPDAASVRKWLKHFHADVSRHLNKLDGTLGRQLWQNFRETQITFQRSYLARLHYTHYNPVHHRLVARASDYPWCSAREFEKAVSPAWVETIESFEYDEIARDDEDEDGAQPLWSAGTCSSFPGADLSAPGRAQQGGAEQGTGQAGLSEERGGVEPRRQPTNGRQPADRLPEGRATARQLATHESCNKLEQSKGFAPGKSRSLSVMTHVRHFLFLLLVLLPLWSARADSGEGISSAFVLDTTTAYGTGEGVSNAFSLNTNFPLGVTVSGVSSVFVLNTQPASGPKQSLQVRLLDFATRMPIAGGLVIVRRNGRVAVGGTTNAAGIYLAPAITPIPQTLEMRAAGYDTAFSNIPVPDAGQAWATTYLMRARPAAPALQTVNRTPAASALGTLNPPPPGDPLAPVLVVYNPFTRDFSATAPVDVLRKSVVMAHGWRSSLTPNDDVLEWPRDMARKMQDALPPADLPNIFAWDWKHQATRALPPIENAVTTGAVLGQALYAKLGPLYAQRVHFIGHSLGTIVCRNACDYLHGDFPRIGMNAPVPWDRSYTRPHVTLMDEAEIASIFGRNVTTASQLGALAGGAGGIVAGVNQLVRDWKSPIPAAAAQIDNYISLVGLGHSEAVNVCLDGWIGQTVSPVAGHSYAHKWYRRTVAEGTPPPRLGWRLSPEGAGIFPPQIPAVFPAETGSLWWEAPLPGEPLRLERVPHLSPEACIIQNLNRYALTLPAIVDRSLAEGLSGGREAGAGFITYVKDSTVRTTGNVTVSESDKTGTGWDALSDSAGNFGERIVSDTPGNWSLQSFSGLLMRNASANRAARGNGGAGVSQPFAWITITLPPDAAMLAFDFKVTGDPADDCLVFAVNDQNFFTLPLKFAPDSTAVSTDMMNISAWAGQEVELMFGLAGGTSTAAELLVDGLRLITVPPPVLTLEREGGNIALRWPASASGWSLEASDTLAIGSWQPEPAPIIEVENGDIIFIQPPNRARRFYRLRR